MKGALQHRWGEIILEQPVSQYASPVLYLVRYRSTYQSHVVVNLHTLFGGIFSVNFLPLHVGQATSLLLPESYVDI